VNDPQALGQLMHDTWMNAPQHLGGPELWTYIAQAVIDQGVGDKHHSLEELYDYRMLYNAHTFNEWARNRTYPVVKSRRHSDGELPFGKANMFVVVATLPEGQVANHYETDVWDLFQVPEVPLPPEYDGHNAQMAAERLRDALKRSNR